MSFLRGALKRTIRDEHLWGTWGRGNGTVDEIAGRITQDKALRLVAVHACVRLLADSIAQLPIHTFRREGAERIPVDPPAWLANPAKEMSRFELFERIMTSLLLDGNAYLLLTRDRLGEVVEAWPIHPARVDVVRTGRNDVAYVVTLMDGSRETLNRFDVWHIRAFTMPGSVKGVSPISYARRALALTAAAEEFGADWFIEGATPSSVLSTPETLDDAEARRQQAKWVAAHRGRRTPAVLSGGFKWEAISVSPNESQFLETRQFQTVEIARLFRVPPFMIGELTKQTTWGSGVEQIAIGWVTYSLMPWTVRLEQSSAQAVLFDPGVEMRFDFRQLLRGDTLGRFQAYVHARNASWLNADEIRALEDLPPIPDGKGQEYIQPLNMGPLGTKPAEEPTPPPDEEVDE